MRVAGATSTIAVAGTSTVIAGATALFAPLTLFAGATSLTLLLADRGAVAARTARAAVEGASDCHAAAEEEPSSENAAADDPGKDEPLAFVRRSWTYCFCRA